MLNTKTGWIPDIKSEKDLHWESPAIQKNLNIFIRALAKNVNLQNGFPPVYDQGDTNSCTANALAALIDYFGKKTSGEFVSPSRMFIYKTTRNILKTNSPDSGAYLRTALEATVLFGAAPELYWPFEPANLNVEPPAFIYSFAKQYATTKYFRFDPDGLDKDVVLMHIKASLMIGLPVAFGFYLFKSITLAAKNGEIPFPADKEEGIGGHAIVAVGYDDEKEIKNGDSSTIGAFRIRNSWGTEWGDNGYGWLPYEYVLKSLAIDWWAILKTEWFDLDSKIFSIND